jgi:hypothetical protein
MILSSDILESQFGPTAVEILYQSGDERIIITKVEKNGQILELSQVRFLDPGKAEYPEVHKKVLGGESMGKAFRAAGIPFLRKVNTTEKRVVPADQGPWYDDSRAATFVDVEILVGPNRKPYAKINESYSPLAGWPESGNDI